jgi:CHASE2 domain-containing sensor protein
MTVEDATRPDGTVTAPGLFAMFIVAGAFACLLMLDPFGIGTASSQRSEQAVLRITAPLYEGSDRVAVVLIDDAFIARTGSTWPVGYAVQGKLLRSIMQAQPAGVFVDLVYRRPHEGATDTATADARSDDSPGDLTAPLERFANTPLVIAGQIRRDVDAAVAPALCTAKPSALRESLLDDNSVLPVLSQWVAAQPTARGIALVGWWGCGDRYPLILAGRATEESPAFALLSRYCALNGESSRECAPLKDSATIEAHFARPMVVRWGAYPPATQQPYYAAGVCQRYATPDGAPSYVRRLWTSLQQLLLGVFEDLRAARNPNVALPCPSVEVIPASVLWSGDAGIARELLAGRFVMVGASVSGIADWHQSPVHGQVPGVVLHAMALDNLLSLGTRYATELSGFVSTVVATVLLVILAFVAPRVHLQWRERNDRRLAAAALAVWLGLAGFLAWSGASGGTVFAAVAIGLALDLIAPMQTFGYVLIVVLSAIGASTLLRIGIAPANWIGMILVAMAFFLTSKQFFRDEHRKGFPHKASFVWPALRPWLGRLEFHRFERRDAPTVVKSAQSAPPPSEESS